MFITLLKRELNLCLQDISMVIEPIIFIIAASTVFVLAIGPEKEILSKVGPSIILVVTIFASMLATNHIFTEDLNDGSLEQLILAVPAYFIIACKILAYWLIISLTLILIMPVLSAFFFVPPASLLNMAVVLIICLLNISIINVFSSILTLKLSKGSLLNILITIPLSTGTLIFAVSAVQSGTQSSSIIQALSLLIALVFIILPIVLYFGSLVLKHQDE